MIAEILIGACGVLIAVAVVMDYCTRASARRLHKLHQPPHPTPGAKRRILGNLKGIL